jgi:TPR repeat protein
MCAGYGWGVPVDTDRAREILLLAADEDAIAQYLLGRSYHKHEPHLSLERSDEQAVMWYRKAAEQGYARAQCNLGVAYDNGRGVAQDYVQAVVWYRKAAEQGRAKAQCNLGVAYDNGRGVAQDLGQAMMWYAKAAEQGDEDVIGRMAIISSKSMRSV